MYYKSDFAINCCLLRIVRLTKAKVYNCGVKVLPPVGGYGSITKSTSSILVDDARRMVNLNWSKATTSFTFGMAP